MVKLTVIYYKGQGCLNGFRDVIVQRLYTGWMLTWSLSVPTGKRICLGEGIARNEVFLFFTTILQNFSVSSHLAPKDIDLTPKESGIGKIPPTYQICFLARWSGWGSQVSPLLLGMASCFCLWETCWKPGPRPLLTSSYCSSPKSQGVFFSLWMALEKSIDCRFLTCEQRFLESTSHAESLPSSS